MSATIAMASSASLVRRFVSFVRDVVAPGRGTVPELAGWRRRLQPVR